jgi:carbonic anhydrase/acetyltransferase-like protein (isoleucine patch superfamily)
VALLLPFDGVSPRVAPDAFLAPNAVIVGNVTVGPEASIWFGAVLRGDHPDFGVEVGPRSSIQDNCVVHVGDWQPTYIGADVTVGHGAEMESCTVEDGCVIGMGAVILQEAIIGAGSLVAAGSVVLEGSRVPPGSLVAGVPASVKKSLGGSSAKWVGRSGGHYVELSRRYLAHGIGQAHPAMEEATHCDLCGGPVLERHCKILCLTCGYQRDCSDP